MNSFFVEHKVDACCLCGSTSDLTGEHKFKRSILKKEFSGEPMAIGTFGGTGFRHAQGPKSTQLHFASRLCVLCNGTRTQPADREFDAFHKLAEDLVRSGQEPDLAFSDSRYEIGSEKYLNLFRYFAKILCCHIAEVGGPRPASLSSFAVGESDRNIVSLRVQKDQLYDQLRLEVPDLQFASHGGLTVQIGKRTGLPTGFLSSLSFGPVNYEFFISLLLPAQVVLSVCHQEFSKRCRQLAIESTRDGAGQ
jgi:hypothetical protein